MRIATILTVFLLGFQGRALAQGVPPDLLPKGAKPYAISAEVEGLYVIDIDPQDKRPVPRYLLVVRTEEGDLEMVARAEVETIQDRRVFLKFDGEFLVKAPLVGDLAVSISAGAPDVNDLGGNAEAMLNLDEPPLAPEPGYIQIDGGRFQGVLDSTSSNATNAFKKGPSYNLGYMHFLWYLDFLWRMGIEFEQYSGQFPTKTYYREDGVSSDSFSQFSLNVRTRKYWNDRIRLTGRLLQFTNDFSTFNTDENLLSSSYTGTGLGARVDWEFSSTNWVPENPNRWVAFNIHALSAELDLYPMITAKDKGVSRGADSAGSLRQELIFGARFFMYTGKIPYVKRWFLEIQTRQSTLDLKFNGATSNELINQGAVYPIPEGGTYVEKRSVTVITLGVRFDDMIGRFLKPR